jgi:voltage-gated potassium channel
VIGAGTAAAGPRYEQLPRRVRRRLLALALLRSGFSAAALVVLYYVLPLDGGGGTRVALGLALGLLVFAGLVAFQVWQIARSDYPRLRAIEALSTALPLFLVVFAAAYFLMDRARPGSFSESLNRTDGLYYTITVFSTVGFGDIVPHSEPARITTMVQMLADLAVIGLVARLLLSAVNSGLQRRAAAESPDRTEADPDEPAGP